MQQRARGRTKEKRRFGTDEMDEQEGVRRCYWWWMVIVSEHVTQKECGMSLAELHQALRHP